ncbi:hypothetical protein [Allorhizobium borbori]|uniref:Uncharacterized protein n=1 Tax=Allorhizobium borbori TaxID=485907 RepID=A0A7W6P1K0_9HYPH|nr:hypothetical protein [Allorhizobium borbori]MBB4102879.1 hypothetical protein [Allorhizobium borbori]
MKSPALWPGFLRFKRDKAVKHYPGAMAKKAQYPAKVPDLRFDKSAKTESCTGIH